MLRLHENNLPCEAAGTENAILPKARMQTIHTSEIVAIDFMLFNGLLMPELRGRFEIFTEPTSWLP